MKKIIKVLLSACLLLMFFTCACGTSNGTVTVIPSTPVPTAPIAVTEAPTASEAVPEPTEEPVRPMELKPVVYYSLNADTFEIEVQKAVVSGSTGVTPEYVLSLISGSMEEIGIEVEYNSAEFMNAAIYIDFNGSSTFLSGVDKMIETNILDASAQSILDNFPGCSNIVFSIDGGPYVTENYSMADDFVYMERNN